MNVLVTGNRGYIGSVLVPLLQEKGYTVTGYDAGYYDAAGILPCPEPNMQIRKDIRDVSSADLAGIDAVIHLAALSNDPLGDFDPSLTERINFHGTVRCARAAKEAGAKRFVYSSSQSMYGVSDTENELDEDDSEKNPVTVYARTKWEAEQEIKKMADENFVVTCLRPSTVFGASPMLRTDIVFNNLVGCAYTTGHIEVKSDGTPWRPVVHVRDVSKAFIAGLEAPADIVNGESFNVGVQNGNYTVRDLAEAAQRAVLGSTLVCTGEHGSDSRTYRVSFKKIFAVLKDYFVPEWDLDKGGKELVDYFKQTGFTEEQFRGRACVRLAHIKYLQAQNLLDADLRWKA